MEKSKGRVRNFVVSNKEMFCDYLARSLCKMQVQYVQIDNEFHFNDKIYRFYNFEECLELDGKVVFVSLDKERLVSLNPQDLLFTRTSEDLVRYLEPQDELIGDVAGVKYKDERPVEKRASKQLIRRDNKMVNQRIKNSYKQQGFRNRRNG